MNAEDELESEILASWQVNAAPWTRAIRERQIGTRERVTNRAIVEAVLAASPATCLDVGCGEGWLVRELMKNGVAADGIDAISPLIAAARRASPENAGRYHVMSYGELAAGGLESRRFDAIVFNFSLLGEASTECALSACNALLNEGGRLFIQTLHPVHSCGEHPYADGWRGGTWAGFGEAFERPAPWYFRTTESWGRLLEVAGFAVVGQHEPLDPETSRPASIIFVCSPHPRQV